MRKLLLVAAVVVGLVFSISCSAFARDVYVKGYTRKNGTYVRPHYRSSPDSYKWNNYGPSKTDSQLLNPRTRDNDNDGTPNYLDRDDDNDSVPDDDDSRQYSPNYGQTNSNNSNNPWK